MIKVYIVVDACSGDDYSADDPTILLVTTNFKEAREFFDDEVSNWEDGLTIYDSKNSGFTYECTDLESHRIMKLVEKEIEV